MRITINQIYNLDCRAGLKHVTENTIDLIVTDPPYAINFGSNEGLNNRPKDGILQGYVDVPFEEYEGFSRGWVRESFRVLKDTGSIYIISGWQAYPTLYKCVEEAGFTILNMLVWHYQFGKYTKKKFVTAFNPVIYAVKNPRNYKFYKNSRFADDELTPNGKKANYKDRESVFYITKERWENKISTPTKLPRKLIEKFIQYSSQERDIILDPFMGSGQTAWVARELDRNYLGFEINKDFYDFAKMRLETNQYLIPIKRAS